MVSAFLENVLPLQKFSSCNFFESNPNLKYSISSHSINNDCRGFFPTFYVHEHAYTKDT